MKLEIYDTSSEKTKEVQYSYDAFGRRVKREYIDYVNTSNSYGRLYFYDRDNIVEERDMDYNVVTRYLHGSGVDDPILLINKEGVFAYTKDGLGSVKELTPINTSAQAPYQRYRYSSYGVTTQMLEGVTTGRKLIENRYAYTGREIEDEVGLYYYRARYYDPELGRFISEDPIGFESGDVNFYGYVGNSPAMYTDPLGLWGIQLGYSFGGFIGFGGGVVSGGIAIVGNGFDLGSISMNTYQSGQFNAGLGLSMGRGIQLSVTPNATCMSDLEGRSFGVGIDSMYGGISVSNSVVGNTYTISGPSLGGSAFGSVSNTNIGNPIKQTRER